jgi:hypothetical protein
MSGATPTARLLALGPDRPVVEVLEAGSGPALLSDRASGGTS